MILFLSFQVIKVLVNIVSQDGKLNEEEQINWKRN